MRTIHRTWTPTRLAITLDAPADLSGGRTEIAGTLEQRPGEGRCGELLDEENPGADAVPGLNLYRCRAAGTLFVATPAGGRSSVDGGPTAKACYCEAHGGEGRAQAEVLRDWAIQAPAGVREWLTAGVAGLDSRDLIVLIRRIADEVRPTTYRIKPSPEQYAQIVAASDDGAATLCGLGLAHRGGQRRGGVILAELCRPAQWESQDLAAAQTRVDYVRQRWGVELSIQTVQGGTHARRRPWEASLGVGSLLTAAGAYASEDEAVAAGLAAWRERVAADVERLRELRGGTLGWGMPVAPAKQPVIVRPQAGECSWDAYGRTAR
jgi:hypothetical protein